MFLRFDLTLVRKIGKKTSKNWKFSKNKNYRKLKFFENWKLSKLGVVHMFYSQIGGAENVSGIIFSIWPNPGSKNREKKFKNCHFSKILFFFKINACIWPFAFAPSSLEAIWLCQGLVVVNRIYCTVKFTVYGTNCLQTASFQGNCKFCGEYSFFETPHHLYNSKKCNFCIFCLTFLKNFVHDSDIIFFWTEYLVLLLHGPGCLGFLKTRTRTRNEK